MSNLKLNLPTEATHDAWVYHVRNLPDSGKIGHNTYAYHVPGEFVGITYHNTTIVKFHKDGRIELDTGGWETPTTKDRMNKVLPNRYGVVQSNYQWFVTDRIDYVRGSCIYLGRNFEIPASPLDLVWDREKIVGPESWQRGGFVVIDRTTGQHVEMSVAP